MRYLRFRLLPVLIPLLGLLLGFLPLPARAVVIYVDKNATGTVHDGRSWPRAYLSVKDGLSAAIAGDEVWVAAGTYVECITLPAGVGLYGGFTGTETDLIQRDWGKNVTTLDGNSAGSVVTVAAGGNDTVLDGFIITKGSGTQDRSLYGWPQEGGGIYCINASPTIRNNTITGNWAANPADFSIGYGGGIYIANGSPVVSGNTISANALGSYPESGKGGGIYSTGGSPKITENTITRHTAVVLDGGGIYCDGGAPVIDSNTISENGNQFTYRSWAHGGGIYCNSPEAVISNNVITGNNASGGDDPSGFGGGIYGLGHITGNKITGNVAVFGGGIYNRLENDPSGGSTISGNSISGNGAYYSGGGVYCGYTTKVLNNTITDNQSNGPYTSGGGGVYGGSRIEGNTITGNWSISPSGGGGGVCDAGVVVGNLIANNRASNGGGAWDCGVVTDNTITGNTGTRGGGVSISIGGVVHNTIANNSGCGVYASGAASIADNVISGNAGGGIGILGSGSIVRNNTITGNTPAGMPGPYDGGGIWAIGSTTVSNNLVTGNRASYGGGLCLNGTASITNTTIAGNIADNYGGALFFSGNATAMIVNSVVAFNNSGLCGSGVTLTQRNSDVYGNAAYNYLDVPDPTGANGNISKDPLFANAASGDLHVQPTSPCIDTGDDAVVTAGDTDLDGNPRIRGAHVDMGAYEAPVPPHLVFSTQPFGGTPGQPLTTQPVILALIGTATDTSFTGPVTLSIKSGTGTQGAVLLGTATVNAISGVATFTDLAMSAKGTDYVLTATSGSLTADSAPFNVPLVARVPIVRASTPPLIDGKLSPSEWIGAPVIPLGSAEQNVILPSVWQGPSDYTGRLRLKWDAQNLYFGLEVTDNILSFPETPLTELYNRDGLEVFLGLKDPQDPRRSVYDNPGDYQVIITADRAEDGALFGTWYSPQAPSVFTGETMNVRFTNVTDHSYTVEGAIPWSSLTDAATLVEGRVIGFNVMGKDNDHTTPTEDAAFSLSGLDASSTNPSHWTTVVLLGLPTVYGDANGDGALTLSDVTAILSGAGGTGATGDTALGDVAPYPSADPRGYGDGKVDLLDAVRLLRHLGGIDNGVPWD